MMSRVSTRMRFILASLLLVLPVLAVAGVLLDESFKRSQEQVVITEFATADVVAQSVAELINGQQLGLQALAEQEAIRAIDQRPDEAAALLDEYRVSRSAINGLFLIGNDGSLVRSTGGI